MIRVKVCGITRQEDAGSIAALGVDYLGFIFYKDSPRYIDPGKAAAIIKSLGKTVPTVGVFVNEKLETVNSVVKKTGLDFVQLHGDYPSGSYGRFSADVIKVVRISGPSDLEGLRIAHAAVRFFLFDTKVEGKHGGTGKSFDWKLLGKKPGGRDFFLAGGLNSDNILSACEAGPYCVDLNSGVETSPGIKDPARVKAVLERMKKYR